MNMTSHFHGRSTRQHGKRYGVDLGKVIGQSQGGTYYFHVCQFSAHSHLFFKTLTVRVHTSSSVLQQTPSFDFLFLFIIVLFSIQTTWKKFAWQTWDLRV
jgi:hypothetical protein